MYKYILLLLPFLVACGETNEPFVMPDSAHFLLTTDSSKTWKIARRFNDHVRMNMGTCFLNYRQTYHANLVLTDNNGDGDNCGESLQAKWEFIKSKKRNHFIKMTSKQLPSMFNIDKEYKFFRILKLTEEELIVRYNHRQFSDEETAITDIYVPEYVDVTDRDFHW